MSSSATFESILLQAGGLAVTLHSQNNSLIPQEVVESTTAVLHEIAQLLASGPNVLLPVEYRQAQYDIDLYKLVHQLMSAGKSGESESAGTQQVKHLVRLEKDEEGFYHKLVSVLHRRNQLSSALEYGKKLAELNSRKAEEHELDDDAAQVREMLLDPTFSSISDSARSPSPTVSVSSKQRDSSPPASPPPPTSSPAPSSPIRHSEFTSSEPLPPMSSPIRHSEFTSSEPMPIHSSSSEPAKQKRTRTVVDVVVQRRKPKAPQGEFVTRMIELQNSLPYKYQHKLDVTRGTLPHNRVHNWDVFPNIYDSPCDTCRRLFAKCEIGDKTKPGRCRLCILRQIACSNFSPRFMNAQVGPPKRKRAKHKIILDPADRIPNDEIAEFESGMQQRVLCPSADITTTTTQCRKDLMPMDEDKPSAQVLVKPFQRDDSYNVRVPTSHDFLRVDL